MATTTTNFGWDIPQSTDLVKDGATAIAALGQDIDTALVDLKGGTTGQVLAKASGTDLDFSWVAQDDSNAIQNTQLTAKGALITAFSSATPATLTVGTNGHVLTADSTTATGITWAAPAGGGKVLQVVSANTTTATSNSTTTQADTTLTATITPTLSTSKILVLVSQNGVNKTTGSASSGVNINLLRGATVISAVAKDGLFTGTNLDQYGHSYTANYLDSPATTSATTYKTQFANRDPSASVGVQINSAMSSITLLEIGA
jgi:hypothetical protein